MARFIAPCIPDNPTGWGPNEEPEQFKDMPFQPFSKGDRLGKVADWTGATYQDRRQMNKYSSQFSTMTSQYAYFHDEDESSFHLVDSSRVQKPIYQRGRGRFTQQKLRKERERRAQQAQSMQVLSKTQKSRERDRQRQLKKWQKQFGRQMQEQRKFQFQNKARDASVQVGDQWAVVEEMDFPRLAKLRMPDVKEPEDLKTCGSLEYYDKGYDRVTCKTEKPLKRINRLFHTVTTTDDPIIRQLAKKTGNVFATDAILSTIMCSTRSNYSWDVIVQKVGNKLFFDKRDNSDFDHLTVSETSTEPPADEGNSINSPRNLSLEAMFINHNFSQQVLKMNEDKYDFEEPNPFVAEDETSEVASRGYRYRQWSLGNEITLVARCEHDAVMHGPTGDLQYANIKALNEWDSRFCGGVDWRSKLDNQRGAVLATELKNNSCKLAKWTVSSILAGSDIVKFGYVSRVSLKDSAKHVVLGMQQFKPTEFAQQINLNMDNGWGILRCIIDICMKLKQGKYLIMKDPNKPVVRIYDIPNNTFESEEEDDDSSEEETSSEDESSSEEDEEEDEKSSNKPREETKAES